MSDLPKTTKANVELILYRMDQQDQKLGAINAKLDTMSTTFVPREEIAEKFKDAHKRIDKLESNQTWLVRAILASIITAIAGLLGLTK